MTKSITEMAREAGAKEVRYISATTGIKVAHEFTQVELEAFAALVREDEREKIALAHKIRPRGKSVAPQMIAAVLAEREKQQEPVAWLIPGSITGDKKLAEANGDYATPLYAAPVDAKAIRAEALEEAAKVCDAYIDRLHEMRDKDMSLPQYQPELAGRQAGAGRCAAAIRGLIK